MRAVLAIGKGSLLFTLAVIGGVFALSLWLAGLLLGGFGINEAIRAIHGYPGEPSTELLVVAAIVWGIAYVATTTVTLAYFFDEDFRADLRKR
jgi:hypothetical protein